MCLIFFFKHKTSYELRIIDWGSDVCSSDLDREQGSRFVPRFDAQGLVAAIVVDASTHGVLMFAFMNDQALLLTRETGIAHFWSRSRKSLWKKGETSGNTLKVEEILVDCDQDALVRSEEHTSELQSLMRISYAVFCLK